MVNELQQKKLLNFFGSNHHRNAALMGKLAISERDFERNDELLSVFHTEIEHAIFTRGSFVNEFTRGVFHFEINRPNDGMVTNENSVVFPSEEGKQ